MMRLLAIILLLASTALADDAPVFQQALTPRQWNFPKDHGRHAGFKIEWWYFTGNLTDSAGHQLGYQLTFFRSAFAPQATSRPSSWGLTDIYFAHAAVSDVDGKQFVFKDRLERGRAGLAESSDHALDVHLLDWSAIQNDAGTIHLTATEDNLAIDLSLANGRGPVLQGPGGVNKKGREAGQASYYYSMTRLPTSGSVTVKGHRFTVTGLSWMDHEFSSNALSENQIGWDWMGLQLNDGRDVMIYRLRNKTGQTDYLSGTVIGTNGRPTYVAADQLAVTGTSPWKSDASGAEYPQQWTIRCQGLPDLTVHSEMPGQELVTSDSTKVTYFEGAADVVDSAGKLLGKGYLEMTGYAGSVNGK